VQLSKGGTAISQEEELVIRIEEYLDSARRSEIRKAREALSG